ncbi:MAG TPA: diguanylate cyclase [Gemmatimonadales bacterium]|nr:diguanylate cyclase [Gemmatimonadales bacterium]
MTASPLDRPERERRAITGQRTGLDRRVGERRLVATIVEPERRRVPDRRAAGDRRQSGGRRRGEQASQRNPVVLFVGDERSESRGVRRAVEWLADEHFALETVEGRAAAADRIMSGDIDAVLLEIPPGEGLDAFTELSRAGSSTPFVLLSPSEDSQLALDAVRAGAQDYLVKGRFDGPQLARTMRYAIERQRVRSALQNQLLRDELTGLYNRRGFTTLAAQDVRLARRGKQDLLLAFADLDDLKVINDTLGHAEGDRALRDVAGILRNTFRESDLVARIGGDEYAVLVRGCEPNAVVVLRHRLNEELISFHRRAKRRYRIAISLGFAHAAGSGVTSVENLLRRADRALYREKRRGAGPGKDVRRPYDARPIDILLVEDNVHDTAVAQEALRRSRLQNRLAVVSDGIEALAYVRREPPDVILLDLDLPRKPGRDVLTELRGDPELADLPVLILTSPDADRAPLEALHPDGYLVKPIDFERLTQAVQAVANLGFTIVKLTA